MADASEADPMVDTRALPIPEGLDGERVDQAVARLTGLSRTVAAALVGDGAVTIGGIVPAKSQRVSAGDWIEITLPGTQAPPAEPELVAGLVIVYEDDDIIVVDKPVGVAAHPSPGWEGPTVIGGLAAAGRRISTSGAAERQGVVHRLDVGTSGLMVVAKSEAAYSGLKRAFKEREVEKTYHAVAQGYLDPLVGTIDAPIDRHPTADYRFAVVAGGRPSVTHYETLEAFPHASLLKIGLETGRTHQIRVHLSALRHPCVGDITYGADPVLAHRLSLARQWLHAVELSFQQPVTGDTITVTSDYPIDLEHALELLRAGA